MGVPLSDACVATVTPEGKHCLRKASAKCSLFLFYYCAEHRLQLESLCLYGTLMLTGSRAAPALVCLLSAQLKNQHDVAIPARYRAVVVPRL